MTSSDQSNDSCIWKPQIKRKFEDRSIDMKFPCRFPDKEKTSEVCTPCLLGDVFAMQYTQMVSFKQQSNLNEEVMTYLRSITSDDNLNDFK